MDEYMLSMNANTNEAAPKIVQAKNMLKAQNMAEGKKLLEEALEVDPKNPEANYILGQIYEFDEDHEKALNCYSVLLETNPSREMKHKLAQAFQNIDNYQKAYILMKELFEENPNDPDMCDEFAHVSMVIGKSADAVEAYNKILEFDKDHEVALTKLAEIYYDEGDKLNHYLIKAKLNYLDNMLSGSVDCLKRALNYAKEEDDLVNVLLNLGKVLTDKGNVSEAMEQYQFVLATQPGNKHAQDKLEKLSKKVEESFDEYSESWIDKLFGFFK